jgi:hypothetical protein
VYQRVKEFYRKKLHPIAEKFYYEIVKGWAKGMGFWKKPAPLFYLAPPRNDIRSHTAELRRYQVRTRVLRTCIWVWLRCHRHCD